MKVCSRCRAERPVTEYSPHKGSAGGLYSQCKSCMRDLASIYYYANKARAQAATRAWKAANPEADRATRRAWAVANAGKRSATQGRRRARQLQATPPWVNHDSINFVYMQAAAYDMTVDHIHPLQHPRLCGLHVPWNLQLLTNEENARKGNRTFPMVLATTNSSVTSA